MKEIETQKNNLLKKFYFVPELFFLSFHTKFLKMMWF